nr:immunoglobulin heavy chain junction region [Macaca mulatta]
CAKINSNYGGFDYW